MANKLTKEKLNLLIEQVLNEEESLATFAVAKDEWLTNFKPQAAAFSGIENAKGFFFDTYTMPADVKAKMIAFIVVLGYVLALGFYFS